MQGAARILQWVGLPGSLRLLKSAPEIASNRLARPIRMIVDDAVEQTQVVALGTQMADFIEIARIGEAQHQLKESTTRIDVGPLDDMPQAMAPFTFGNLKKRLQQFRYAVRYITLHSAQKRDGTVDNVSILIPQPSFDSAETVKQSKPSH